MIEEHISKMLTISTAHVSQNTAVKLHIGYIQYDLDEINLCIYNKSGFGWFVYVPDDINDPNNIIPDDLLDCLLVAKKYGCEWLCLDRDGETIPDLKSYYWDEKYRFCC